LSPTLGVLLLSLLGLLHDEAEHLALDFQHEVQIARVDPTFGAFILVFMLLLRLVRVQLKNVRHHI
jgi:hypothetical protein